MTPEQRAIVVRVARSWEGTPYHDLGEVKGAGVDCAKLLKMVYVESGIIAPFDIGYYAPQHFLHQEEERYIGWVTKFADEIDESSALPGDIVLYKIAKCYAHGAIIIDPGWPKIIHAHYRARMVRRGVGTAIHLGTPILGRKFFAMRG